MEFQESPNQSQEGLPVIEIKPEAERSEDIKPKVEDLGEMNEQVDAQEFSISLRLLVPCHMPQKLIISQVRLENI